MADQTPDTIKAETSPLYVDTFFARQPIFDASKNIWGYALLYRHAPDATKATFDDKDIATLTVISNAIMNLPKAGERAKKLCINFTEESLLRKIPLTLPAATTIILVDESFSATAEVVDALKEFKSLGYEVALNDFSGQPGCEPLLELADLVFIDILNKDIPRLKELTILAKSHHAALAAKRVEDIKQFEFLSKVGYTLFQGFFFEKPVIVPGRKLTSNQISRLMLFKVLEKENPDFHEIARVIETDVSISYRLLALTNSASFSLPRKVDSIRQALVLLGMKQIRSWLWLIFLTDMSPKHKTSELPYLSAIRAKFLERTALNHDMPIAKADLLYLLGLFSLLEAMLDVPFKEIVKNLPLDEALATALSGEVNEYTPWLSMARFFEQGEWDRIDEVISQLELEPMTVANSYAEALTWAKTLQGEGQ
ncbi:EAL and HDOD domain-containing protein [Megalodesulfovibrio paquesii]